MSERTIDTTLAMSCMMGGINFWEGAKIIDKQLEKNNDGTPKKLTAIPYYFLVSHSVELFLKSALVKRGFDERELKKYGHNLKKLLEALQKKDVNVTKTTINVIHSLHIQHLKQEIRYHRMFGDSKISWIPTDLIHKALEELHLLIRISTQGR